MLSRIGIFVTPWTVARQAPLSMEFSRQEYWNELPFPTPGQFPDPGLKPASLVSPALAGRFFITVPPGKPQGNDNFPKITRLPTELAKLPQATKSGYWQRKDT